MINNKTDENLTSRKDNKMNYTAGPWLAIPDIFDYDTNSIDIKSAQKTTFGENIAVATVFGATVYNEEIKKANAQLIAAAPEMFELLEDLVEIMPTALHNGHHDLIERTKTIIKKAKGEL